MIKLKYTLEVVGEDVTLTVLYQHPEVTEIYSNYGEEAFVASNGIEVLSIDRVELGGYENQVFLAGYCGEGRKDKFTFNNHRDAVLYAAAVHEALAEWADKWDGWKEVKNLSDPDPKEQEITIL